MAGSVYLGQDHPLQEYNIREDIKAVQAVFNSSWTYFSLAPLDTTIYMQFFGPIWQQFLSFANKNKHVQLIIDSYIVWYNNGGKHNGAIKPFSPQNGTSTIFDILAVFSAAYYPNLSTVLVQEVPLIVTNDGITAINSTLGKAVNATVTFPTSDRYASIEVIGTIVLTSIITS